MIGRIRNITSVGKFLNFVDSPDLEFGRLNIIYAENGRGKTTLTHILRSLSTGEPKYIDERVTLGASQKSEVTIEVQKNSYSFRSSVWDKIYDDIEIFDSTFTNENVHSGYVINTDQKRELYRFMIGKQGVLFNNRIDSLDNDIRKLNSEKDNIEKTLKRLLGDKTTIDTLMKLKPIEDVDDKITLQIQNIEMLQNKEIILMQPLLKHLILPELPLEEMNIILNKSLAEISQTTVKKVKSQIEIYLDEKGEEWIEQGLKYQSEMLCPFCGLDTSLSELLDSYNSYFGQEYKDLKTEVDRFKKILVIYFRKN